MFRELFVAIADFVEAACQVIEANADEDERYDIWRESARADMDNAKARILDAADELDRAFAEPEHVGGDDDGDRLGDDVDDVTGCL